MTGTSTDRRFGVNAEAAVKVPCKTATTANITLSGEQTIDGVACVTGDRVLVKNQTSGIDNGIYIVDTSSWQRAADWDGELDVKKGTVIRVTDGSASQGFWYVITSDPIIPGTTSVSLARTSLVVSTLDEFGVVGDGVTDDTASLILARNAVGCVELLAGSTYVISSQIAATGDGQGFFCRDGWATIKMLSGTGKFSRSDYSGTQFDSNACGLYCNGFDEYLLENIKIQLESPTGVRTVKAFALRDSMRSRVRVECSGFKECQNGIIVVDSCGENCNIDAYVHDCGTSNDTLATMQITGLTVDDNRIGGVSTTNSTIKLVAKDIAITGAALTKYGAQTDGLNLSGTGENHGLVCDVAADNVGEVFDCYGSFVQATVRGRNVQSTGIKLIHGAQHCQVNGIIDRTVGAAVTIVGTNTGPRDTSYNTIRCVASEVGAISGSLRKIGCYFDGGSLTFKPNKNYVHLVVKNGGNMDYAVGFEAGSDNTVDYFTDSVQTTLDVVFDPTAGTNNKVRRLNDQAEARYDNAIINGNFDIWQRGTSFTAASALSADRWKNSSVGSTYVATQQSFTLGQTDVPGEPKYYHRDVVTSVAGAGNFNSRLQKIEGVRTFAGQKVTLSFYAKADASKNIAVEFAQAFGSGGSPSADITGIGVTTCALTTAWKKFVVSVTLPSISGKTIGTSGSDNLQVVFWWDAGANFNARTNTLGQQSGTFELSQVQLKNSYVATDFDRRHIAEERGLCWQYYQKSFAYATAPAQNVGTNTGEFTWRAVLAGANPNGSGKIQFPFRMRRIPDITLYNPAAANAQARDITAAADCSATGIGSTASETGFAITTTGAAGTAVSNVLGIHWDADAEIYA